MPIISKETWDKFTQEEQHKLKSLYRENEESGCSEDNIDLEIIFPKDCLQPQLTYEDVARELFNGKDCYYTDYGGAIMQTEGDYKDYQSAGYCTSRKQAEKLLAINKLLNVAAYLNKNEDGTPWKPDWEKVQNGEDVIFGIGLDQILNEVRVFEVNPDRISTEIVYFRTEELANQAVAILGEDTVRLALSSDY